MSMVYEMRTMPEMRLEPCESPIMIGGCGHEIEPGEVCYWDADGDGTICKDCAEDIWEEACRELTLCEKLSLLGIAHGVYMPGEEIEWEV